MYFALALLGAFVAGVMVAEKVRSLAKNLVNRVIDRIV